MEMNSLLFFSTGAIDSIYTYHSVIRFVLFLHRSTIKLELCFVVSISNIIHLLNQLMVQLNGGV